MLKENWCNSVTSAIQIINYLLVRFVAHCHKEEFMFGSVNLVKSPQLWRSQPEWGCYYCCFCFMSIIHTSNSLLSNIVYTHFLHKQSWLMNHKISGFHIQKVSCILVYSGLNSTSQALISLHFTKRNLRNLPFTDRILDPHTHQIHRLNL